MNETTYTLLEWVLQADDAGRPEEAVLFLNDLRHKIKVGEPLPQPTREQWDHLLMLAGFGID